MQRYSSQPHPTTPFPIWRAIGNAIRWTSENEARLVVVDHRFREQVEALQRLRILRKITLERGLWIRSRIRPGLLRDPENVNYYDLASDAERMLWKLGVKGLFVTPKRIDRVSRGDVADIKNPGRLLAGLLATGLATITPIGPGTAYVRTAVTHDEIQASTTEGDQ